MPMYVNNRQDKIEVTGEVIAYLQEVFAVAARRERLSPEVEVSLALVDDREMRELNRTYRGVDASTDVLSFAMREATAGEPPVDAREEALLGDVVISLETAARQAREYGHSLEREAGFLLAHGLLHLLGYDHDEPARAEVMQKKQEEIMVAAGLPRLGGTEPDHLLALAAQVQARAYAPYSGFPVGAALLGASGEVYTGCNVENAVYGLSLCAERVAVVQAVAAGERSFLALAVVAGEGKQGYWPCGACRQFLWEFGDMVVMVPGPDGRPQMRQLHQLLPEPFAMK